jgi:hypothetical protein
MVEEQSIEKNLVIVANPNRFGEKLDDRIIPKINTEYSV